MQDIHVNNKLKNIMKVWNDFLILEERKADAARVKSMIEDLKNKYDSEKIYIKHLQNGQIQITYGPEYRQKGKLIGSIKCMDSNLMYKSHPDVIGIGEGEVNPCWYVNLTSRTTEGMGPLLYEVLIEFISHYKKASLKPDPRSVSGAARFVWQNFDLRDDIKKIQLDVNKAMVDNYPEMQQITPFEPKDDTQQFSASYDNPDDWTQSPLSRAYKKNNTELMDILKSHNPPLLVIDDETVKKSFRLRVGKKGK